MSTSSIDGLISGLNTTQIIDQLMQLNAQPQTILKNRVAAQQTRVASLQTLNSKIASVATKAAGLSQLNSWSPSTATGDNADVTVQADAGATASSLTFTINALATAYQATYTTTGAATDPVMTAGLDYTITYTDSRSPVTINTGDGSLQAIADALNDPKTGLHAALVKTGTNASGDPTYSLTVTDAATGAKSGFTVAPVNATDPAFMGGAATSTSGTDASITVAGQTQALTSSSNTFADLMPGVDVTLGAQATGSATITISRDADGLADKVQALVDAVNSALDGISSLTDYNADTKTGGLLTGDSTLRTIRDQVLSAVTDGVNGKSLASVGIQVDKTGKITFDADKFKDAYQADPTGTAAMFAGTATWSDSTTNVTLQSSTWRTQPGTYTVVADATGGTIDGLEASLSGSLLTGATDSPVEGLTVKYTGSVSGTLTYTQGIAAKLEALAQQASNSTDGLITSEIQGKNSSIDTMQDDISDWDVRLAQQRTTLEKQYANLEVALGKLKDQGTWLSGQIASLPQISSGSGG
jgi:flagellar hook-associated protein 2